MEHSSNNNWLTLLRRKIQKKFKRNRQKAANVSDEILQENPEEVNQIPEEAATAEQQNVDTTTADDSNSLSHNCEDMKKELYKLNWYWPNLR
jgi:hypothetical protein